MLNDSKCFFLGIFEFFLHIENALLDRFGLGMRKKCMKTQGCGLNTYGGGKCDCRPLPLTEAYLA